MKHCYSLKAAILFTGLFFVLFTCQGQAQVLTWNDGFEGTPTMHIPPLPWYNCNDSVSTVDTQPGIFNTYKPASQGNSYLSIVTREINPPATVESVMAELLNPLKKDSCYTILLDLCISEESYCELHFIPYYFNNPCLLEVFGFNGDCRYPQNVELLYRTEQINKFDWVTYEMVLRPKNDTYRNIKLRTNFSPAGNYKNSALLVDNLRLIANKEEFIHNDGILFIPEGATDIKWYFEGQLIPGANSTQMPNMGNGRYKATYLGINGCIVTISENYTVPQAESFRYYPNPVVDLVTFEFYSPSESVYHMVLHDEVGKAVLIKDLQVVEGNNKCVIDMRYLATGPYHVNIERPDADPVHFKLIFTPE